MAKAKAAAPKTEAVDHQLPETLLWLWDAPMFIDEVQIGRFYDAVVRPETKTGKTTISLANVNTHKASATLGLKGGLSLGDFAQLLTKLIKPELGVAGGGGYEWSGQKGKTESIEFYEISTPERQLVQLTAHYLLSYPDRLFLVEKPADEGWRHADAIEAVPRALAFLNLPGHNEAHLFGVPETKIIPAAAEFQGGKIDQIYLRLKGKDGGGPPKYPDKIGAKPDELRAERRTYWKWFDENFSATQAMLAVEDASREFGRIQWIDYRLPVTTDGDTMHLHVCAGGKFDTGVFAYNFIKRGYKHGLRLIGTLKSEPDMNVLAIYDK